MKRFFSALVLCLLLNAGYVHAGVVYPIYVYGDSVCSQILNRPTAYYKYLPTDMSDEGNAVLCAGEYVGLALEAKDAEPLPDENLRDAIMDLVIAGQLLDIADALRVKREELEPLPMCMW